MAWSRSRVVAMRKSSSASASGLVETEAPAWEWEPEPLPLVERLPYLPPQRWPQDEGPEPEPRDAVIVIDLA
jgi:hypothetical protein